MDAPVIHKEITGKWPEFIFLDEVYVVSGWEKVVRKWIESGKKVVVSGSSSKFLSREIASSLRGRVISRVIFPFSFREFLKSREASFNINLLSTKERGELLSLLREYLRWGGFPQVVLENSTNIKKEFLKEYPEVVILRDVIERYGIKNTFIAKYLFKRVISSNSKEFSIHGIFNDLKIAGAMSFFTGATVEAR